MSNPLAAAIEALELAAQKFEILAAAGVELTDGVCPKYSYQEARDAARSARTALAEAEGSVNLPVRWEMDAEDDGFIVCRLGIMEVGYIERLNRKGVERWRCKIPQYGATFHDTPKAAKAALLAAVRGDAT